MSPTELDQESDCPPERLAVLTGRSPTELRRRRWFGRLPSNPRCILCYAPFGAPGSWWMRAIGRGQYSKNPRLCERCFHGPLSTPGGCELEIAALFVDVRGSTALAERLGPAAYARRLHAYYRVAMDEMVARQAFVEITGDEVYGFFLPAFSGQDTARTAIEAAERILLRVEDLQLGAGVHVGTAWIGVVGGAANVSDFRSVGDPVNVGSRLVGQAAPGECLISEEAYQQAQLQWANLEQRELRLAGKSEVVTARVMRLGDRG